MFFLTLLETAVPFMDLLLCSDIKIFLYTNIKDLKMDYFNFCVDL